VEQPGASATKHGVLRQALAGGTFLHQREDRRSMCGVASMMRLVPAGFSQADGGAAVHGDATVCGTPMQVVATTLRYFNLHFPEPIEIAEVGPLLGIAEDCLDFSFDQVRGMTPAQALLDLRLNQLFTSLTRQPRQGLGRAVRACGLGPTPDVLGLFEQTFGIAMPLFLLTCRRAADDRQFRLVHPEPDALVLPS
jgi:AraC-like DNA-binding protein